jgi:hypothetical protein
MPADRLRARRKSRLRGDGIVRALKVGLTTAIKCDVYVPQNAGQLSLWWIILMCSFPWMTATLLMGKLRQFIA